MQQNQKQTVTHPLKPIWNEQSRVLILGTMPSPKSREAGMYYAHPQNRFWNVLAQIFEEEVPVTNYDRIAFALRHKIALWDVLAGCEIVGAADSSIQNPIPNPIEQLLQKSKINLIFTTGKTAYSLYQKLCFPKTGIAAQLLPSPSPANCKVSFWALCESYRVLLPYLWEE